MTKLSGVKWFGAQAGNIESIRPFLSVPVANSVDICFGSGALTLNKPRSKLETMVDIDSRVTTLFTVIRDRTQELAEALWMTPYSREEFAKAIAPLSGDEDELEIARRFAFACSASIRGGSHFTNGDFRTHRNATSRWSVTTSEIDSLIGRLYTIAARLRTVQIVNTDAVEYLTREINGSRIIDIEDMLLYADPPFIKSTRKQQKGYKYEVADSFHRNLFDALDASAGYVFILGHQTDMYASMYEDAGWTRFDYDYRTNSNGEAVLSLWANKRLAAAPLNRQIAIEFYEYITPELGVNKIQAGEAQYGKEKSGRKRTSGIGRSGRRVRTDG